MKRLNVNRVKILLLFRESLDVIAELYLFKDKIILFFFFNFSFAGSKNVSLFGLNLKMG